MAIFKISSLYLGIDYSKTYKFNQRNSTLEVLISDIKMKQIIKNRCVIKVSKFTYKKSEFQ